MPINSNSASVNNPSESIINGSLNTQAALSEVLLAYEIQQQYHTLFKHDGSRWMMFSPASYRWTEDHNGNRLRDVVRVALHKYAPDPGPPPLENCKIWKSAKARFEKWQTNQKINAVMKIAATLPLFRERPQNFDRNPYLVGLPDSHCWDLTTDEVRKTMPSDMITKSLRFRPVEGDYRTTLLYQKLSETLAVRYHDQTDDIIKMILRMAGAALAVDKSRHEFLLLTGTPGGGKSALVIDFWLDVFGDYGSTISRKIADDRPGQHMEWVMPTEHYRLMVNADLPAGAFAADVLSRLVENRPVEGNKMRENTRTFLPKASIWGACNAEPRGRGGLFRRIRPVRFRDEIKHKDEHLSHKLRDPREAGIWLYAAVESWRATRYSPAKLPKMVQDDIRRYKEINSPLEAFVRERLILKPDDPAYGFDPSWWFVPASDMYADYKSYCESLDIKAVGINKLKTELTAGNWRIDDHKETKGKRRRGYRNCFLKSQINASNRNFYSKAEGSEMNFTSPVDEINPENEQNWA